MAGKGGNSTDAFGVLVLTDTVEEPGTLLPSAPDGEAAATRPLLARIKALAARPIRRAPDTSSAQGGSALRPAGKKRSPAPYLDDNRILRIGRRRFGIGLLWVAQQEGVSLREAAQSNAIAGGAPDLYIRRRKAQQIGFAFASAGLAQGHGAAATGFRIPSDDDWIAVFALEQITAGTGKIPVWWLVGYREDLVYEDKLFYEPAAAQAALQEHLAAPGWARVIAPEDWQIPYAQPGTLAEWFSPRKAGNLTSTSTIKAYLVPAAVVVLVAASGVGGYLYWQNVQEQERLWLEMQARQSERDRLASLQTPPWVGTPTVAEFLRACTTSVERNLMFVPGWTPGNLVCTHDAGRMSVSTSWSRSGGRSAWIIAAGQERAIQITLDEALNSASFSEEVAFTPRTDIDLEPLTATDLDRLLRLRFDTLLLDAGLSQVAARPAPEAAQEQGAPIWNYHRASFRTSAMLEEYLAVVADLPAIVPEGLSYSPTNHEWVLDIRIYHPPIGGLR